MLNKKNVWFLTLFSIIIVMTLYYIADPKIKGDLYVNKDASVPEALSITTNESEAITAMKIDRDATIEKEVNAIKEILTDELKTTEEVPIETYFNEDQKDLVFATNYELDYLSDEELQQLYDAREKDENN